MKEEGRKRGRFKGREGRRKYKFVITTSFGCFFLILRAILLPKITEKTDLPKVNFEFNSSNGRRGVSLEFQLICRDYFIKFATVKL